MGVSAQEPERVVRVCALYPDLMSIYADRGNLIVLERRCAWRGIGFKLSSSGLGEPVDGVAHDIYYLGGGQDRDQRLCAQDLVETKRDALHLAAERGAIVLGVCGGYQLLGQSYALDDEQLPGVGLLDVRTVREPGPRLIGNVAIEVVGMGSALSGSAAAVSRGDAWAGGADPVQYGPRDAHTRVMAGFENHGGRTYLEEGCRPLGRVLKGHGNDGRSGYEGARSGNVIGTYLHGPLLPKNAWFADWLIATALGISLNDLSPLDDSLERAAHKSARRVAELSAGSAG